MLTRRMALLNLYMLSQIQSWILKAEDKCGQKYALEMTGFNCIYTVDNLELCKWLNHAVQAAVYSSRLFKKKASHILT